MAKTYLYKAYNSAGTTLLATWIDVISDPTFTYEMNTAGTSLTLNLARSATNFGEGADVAFGNKIKIYCVDAEAPNGVLIFTGFIDNYTPVFGTNEYIEVVLMSYGFELNNIMFEQTPPANPFYDNVTNAFFLSAPGTSLQFGQTTYAAIGLIFPPDLAGVSVVEVFGGFDVGAQCSIWTDDGGSPGTIIGSWNSVKSLGMTYGVKIIGGGVFQLVDVNDPNKVDGADTTLTRFQFSAYPGVQPDGITPYWMAFRSTGAASTTSDSLSYVDSGSDTVSYGQSLSTDSSATWSGGGDNFTTNANQFGLRLFSSTPETTVPMLSGDPQGIFDGALDQATNITIGTIASAGTTVSYTFNENTLLEVIEKALELAPNGWFYYVDLATSQLNAGPKSGAADYKFVLGRDILNFTVEKRSEDIINAVYFTGADGFFRKYTRPASIALYGQRILKYQDERVSRKDTAQIIAETYLQHSVPEVRIRAEIVDSNINPASGIDLEALRPGQIVAFRNFGAADTGLWDVTKWDQGYWDYNVNQIETLVTQITRIEYAGGSAIIYASSIPLDVNKRIEDINRNLELSQTAANPVAPTEDGIQA